MSIHLYNDISLKCTLLGAQIENVVNQAALKAIAKGSDIVCEQHLEDARDEVLMGATLDEFPIN
jgi:ATP-dependent Zn protease